MTIVGIDAIRFDSPRYYLPLDKLATARGADPEKFKTGLGQHAMAVTAPGEDIVTMAANAAHQLLKDRDNSKITHLLFATESGIDQSKSAGIYVHELLKLPKHCRNVEFKQACYASTAALQMGLALLRQNPEQEILLIASDIARYGLGTVAESSQGGGAVAVLLSANPKLLAIDTPAAYVTEDLMDFWRPNYRDEAIVDGKYSCDIYLRLLRECFAQYQEQTNLSLADYAAFCLHTPLPRLAEKGLQKLAVVNKVRGYDVKGIMEPALKYARVLGNCYTAALYVSLTSLLENRADLNGQRVGLYSYGSGSTAEFLSGTVQDNYQAHTFAQAHQAALADRQALSLQEYESFYQFSYPTDGSELLVPSYNTGQFRLTRIAEHQRHYEQVS